MVGWPYGLRINKKNDFSLDKKSQIMKPFSFFLFCLWISNCAFSQDFLTSVGRISSSDDQEQKAELAIDGNLETYWDASEDSEEKWLFFVLTKLTEIKQLKISMEDDHQKAIQSFAIQNYINGRWENKYENDKNEAKGDQY